MSRSRRRLSRLIGVLTAVVMVSEACGGVTPTAIPTGRIPESQPSSADPSTRPTEAAVGGKFAPMDYPPGGVAPCAQAAAPDANHAAYAGAIKRVRATDEHTVVFELCGSDVAFRSRLAASPFAINDTAWLAAHIDPAKASDQAIVTDVNGTGPYRLEAWHRGSDIILTRNENYRGTRAAMETVVLRWRGAASERLVELQSGTVDGSDDIDPADVGTVDANVALTAIERPGQNVFYVGFNNANAPFDNVDVRRAIAMGIDRAHIVESFFPRGSQIATHFAPCAIPNGCGGDPWYDFDPALARQLLAGAGYPKGFTTKLRYSDIARPYLSDPSAVAEEIRAQLLANLNIDAEIEVVTWESFQTMVVQGRADGIHLLGDTFATPDTSSVLDPKFGDGASKEFGGQFDDVTAALGAADSTTDDAARAASYAKANDAIRKHVPMIPIAHQGTVAAFRADVQGALVSPVRQERFASMIPGDRRQFVWLAATEPPGLYCADETDPAAYLACAQMSEGLFSYQPGTASITPALAEGCDADPESTIWTCRLRSGIVFHDGSALDANDVVLSFAVQWDATHPLHRGHTGRFQPFIETFGGLLNAPSASP